MVDFYGFSFHVGIYTIHGCYGSDFLCRTFVFAPIRFYGWKMTANMNFQYTHPAKKALCIGESGDSPPQMITFNTDPYKTGSKFLAGPKSRE